MSWLAQDGHSFQLVTGHYAHPKVAGVVCIGIVQDLLSNSMGTMEVPTSTLCLDLPVDFVDPMLVLKSEMLPL
jgi:hypothetical protein